MRKISFLIFIFYLILINLPQKSYGSELQNDSSQLQGVGKKLEIEWEYLTPVEKDRQIDTLTLNIFQESSHYNHFSLYRGVTITRAWGNLEHMDKIQDTSAFGIGPVYLIRYEPIQGPHALFSFDMSGGLIFYSRDFPTGGDFYNFMWRIGPNFIYQIDDKLQIDIGYKLMHVSNGQQSGSPAKSHNPSYNAGGITLSFTKLF